MSTVTRRERRQQERARRVRAGGASDPRRQQGPRSLYVAIGVVVIVAALIAGGRALGVFGPPAPSADPLKAAKYNVVAGDAIGTHEADESNAHVPAGQNVTYKTDPPTSGSHWDQAGAAPTSWGIKTVTIPNEAIVHNLEHGGIVIFHQGLSADDLSKLSELTRTMSQNGYPKIVLEPYPLKDAGVHIALSAWRWSLKLQSFDDVQIVKFVKAHYEGPDAPEPQTM